MKAYYFSNKDKSLRYGDDRKIQLGITHKVSGPVKACGKGLHASLRMIDALKYAPGAYLWLVDIGGEIDKSDDKICGTERSYLSGFDATKTLRIFARKQALINIKEISYIPEYDIILEWLETGNEKIRVEARNAAEDAERYFERYEGAAEYAVCSAIYSAWPKVEAAKSAAWSMGAAISSAIHSAVHGVEEDEAYDISSTARYAAARYAAEDAAEEMLHNLLPDHMCIKKQKTI